MSVSLTAKEERECIGEKFIDSAFPNEYKITHNDWNNYKTYRHKDDEPIDGKIFDGRMRLCGVYEVKNWTDINRVYCQGTIQTEIIDRFNQYPHVLKILFISYIKLLSTTAIKRIRDAGIHIVEIGKRINGYDFKTTLLVSLRTQIRKLINSLTKSAQTNFIQYTLPVVVNHNANTNNANNTNNKQIDNTNKLTYSQIIEELERRNVEMHRLEMIRLRRLHGKG
jgi:hypothetical protein